MNDTSGRADGSSSSAVETTPSYTTANVSGSARGSATTSLTMGARETVRASRTEGAVAVRLVPFVVKSENPDTSWRRVVSNIANGETVRWPVQYAHREKGWVVDGQNGQRFFSDALIDGYHEKAGRRSTQLMLEEMYDLANGMGDE